MIFHYFDKMHFMSNQSKLDIQREIFKPIYERNIHSKYISLYH